MLHACKHVCTNSYVTFAVTVLYTMHNNLYTWCVVIHPYYTLWLYTVQHMGIFLHPPGGRVIPFLVYT